MITNKTLEIKTLKDLYDNMPIQGLVCDKCKMVIDDHINPGVIVVGNIYTANTPIINLGGLIGDNFPHWCDEGRPPVTANELGTIFKFSLEEIRPNCLHITCLMSMIDIRDK
jgi:hypothetical protein